MVETVTDTNLSVATVDLGIPRKSTLLDKRSWKTTCSSRELDQRSTQNYLTSPPRPGTCSAPLPQYLGFLQPSMPLPRAANLSTRTGAPFSQAHYVAKEDGTSRAGAVYVFSRLTTTAGNTTSSSSSSSTPRVASICPDDDTDGGSMLVNGQSDTRRFYCPRGGKRGQGCGWEESIKFTASDRRRGDLFGRCLSVNHDDGVVVVGAPGASLTGLWREVRKRAALGVQPEDLVKASNLFVVTPRVVVDPALL